MIKQFYVYILTNDYKTTLYVGVTNDILRRIAEHKSQLIDGFTKKYNIHNLIYYECYPDAKTAIAREKQIKLWRREKKVLLIENTNPDWRDLSEEW